jgi:hypothetical protein
MMVYIIIVVILSVLIVPSEHVKAVSAVSLNKTKATIYVGCTVKLKLKNAKKISWKTDDKSIASVNSSGVVTSMKSGCVKLLLSAIKRNIARQ